MDCLYNECNCKYLNYKQKPHLRKRGLSFNIGLDRRQRRGSNTALLLACYACPRKGRTGEKGKLVLDLMGVSEARAFSVLHYDIKVGKTYWLDGDSVRSATDGNGYNGRFETINARSMEILNDWLDGLGAKNCIISGTSYLGEFDGPLGAMTRGWDYHTRTKDCFPAPDVQLTRIDIDTAGMPAALRRRVASAEAVRNWLEETVPELVGVGLVVRASSSGGVCLPDGTPATGRGWHVLLWSNGEAETLNRLFAQFALKGRRTTRILRAPEAANGICPGFAHSWVGTGALPASHGSRRGFIAKKASE